MNSVKLLILQQNQELQETNSQLTEVQKETSRQNIELLEINKKLKEANHIKEEYIGYFLNMNSIYLEKLQEFKKW